MTSQFDFTNNEWSDIALLPVLVGYAVAKIEESGLIGNYMEIRTLVGEISEPSSDSAARALIEGASLIDVKDKVDELEEHEPQLLADVAVAACQAVARLIDERADADEAAAYKAWVYDIGYQVANAAKENGVRVSPPEIELLDRTKVALGIAGSPAS